jgi:hypothetical protein
VDGPGQGEFATKRWCRRFAFAELRGEGGKTGIFYYFAFAYPVTVRYIPSFIFAQQRVVFPKSVQTRRTFDEKENYCR